MFKRIITADRMIIDRPHAVYVSHGAYNNLDINDYSRARSYLYRNATGTVGFSAQINGSAEIYSYAFFEDEQDLLVFMLKLQGKTRRVHIWSSPNGYTFYKVLQVQHF
jgi:hypothetical protein